MIGNADYKKIITVDNTDYNKIMIQLATLIPISIIVKLATLRFSCLATLKLITSDFSNENRLIAN